MGWFLGNPCTTWESKLNGAPHRPLARPISHAQSNGKAPQPQFGRNVLLRAARRALGWAALPLLRTAAWSRNCMLNKSGSGTMRHSPRGGVESSAALREKGAALQTTLGGHKQTTPMMLCIIVFCRRKEAGKRRRNLSQT